MYESGSVEMELSNTAVYWSDTAVLVMIIRLVPINSADCGEELI